MKRTQWKKLWLKLFSEYHCMMDPDGDMIIFVRRSLMSPVLNRQEQK